MYAIIKTGGKQYTVKPGDIVRVEKLEAELGAELNMKDVVLVGGEKTFVGSTVSKAVVTVVVTNQQRGPKVIFFKKKRRQGYRRTGGHRQPFTEIFVMSITSPEGQTEKSDAKPQVYSPERKAEKLAKGEEHRQAMKARARAADGDTATPTEKPVAKKASTKKTAAKKGVAKKRPTAKKKTAAKKTAKKK